MPSCRPLSVICHLHTTDPNGSEPEEPDPFPDTNVHSELKFVYLFLYGVTYQFAAHKIGVSGAHTCSVSSPSFYYLTITNTHTYTHPDQSYDQTTDKHYPDIDQSFTDANGVDGNYKSISGPFGFNKAIHLMSEKEQVGRRWKGVE